MSFASDIKAFASDARNKLDRITGNVVSELSARVIDRTPVGNPALWKHPAPKDYRPGRARGNWQLGIGGTPDSETGRLDPAGDVTLREITGAIPAAAGGLVYYIANLVPYGQRLEDGWSTQAPSGMVGLTAIEFPSVVATAAALARA